MKHAKNFYGKNTYLKQTLYSYARLTNNHYFDRTFHNKDLVSVFTGEKAIELANEEFTTIGFPYVKNHPNPPALYGNIILPYKNRIFCYFPSGKKWIADLFVLYKHHFYKLFHNSNDYDYGLEHLPLLAQIGNDNLRRAVPPRTFFADHDSVNMYEMVFNKNIEDIYKIYPDYKPNPRQLEIIDMAHDTSMLVLKDLGLSHEMVVEDEYIVRDFLNDTGVMKIMQEYLKYSKTLKK